VALLAQAAPVSANLSGSKVHLAVYSDVCTKAGSGEMQGERIILATAKKTVVMFQEMSGGNVSQPLWAEAGLDGSKITFELHDARGGTNSFAGTLSAQEIVGSFSRSGNVLHLPHRPSIADIGECTSKK
jgi:hypothetical protein